MAVDGQKGLPVIFAGLLVVCATCTSEEILRANMQIGEKMGNFTLSDLNGKSHSLYEFEGRKAIAVIFIATRCPYSNAFNHVMESLAEEYGPRGVQFIGINANKTEPAAEVAEHARAHGLKFLILKDQGNPIADRLGARVTPEVFLLDSRMILRYHGALGNSHQPTTHPEEASDVEVRPALESVLGGQPVALAETKAFGCTIKRI